MPPSKSLILALFVLTASHPVSAQQPDFENLPGVYPKEATGDTAKKQNCTSELVETRNSSGGTGLPQRVYRCSEGAISIYSSNPPSGGRINPDPYIHGEEFLNFQLGAPAR